MIYFIQGRKSDPIKIGYSKNKETAARRLENLQIGYWKQLNIIGLLEGTKKNERALHKKFHRYNSRGEWFKPEKELTDFIRQFCNLSQIKSDSTQTTMQVLIKNFPKETQNELKIMAIKKGMSVAQLITFILMNKVLEEKKGKVNGNIKK